jgi:hypothetical protein
MGMTKAWLGELQEQAAKGDVAVQEQLASIGLWTSAEELMEREAMESFYENKSLPRFHPDETEDIPFGHGDSFDDETGFPLDSFDEDVDFEPLGLDEFWQPEDSSADGEALASAGYGTDEDYGCFGDFENTDCGDDLY